MAVRKMKLKSSETRYIGYFKMDGVQYQKRFPTRAEAAEWVVDEKRRLKFMSQSLTYLQASDEYLQDCERRIAANTFQEKQRHLREFAKFMQSDFCMEETTVDEARLFLNAIQQEKGSKSANRRLRTLKALWNWCKHNVPENPWREVRQFPEEEFVKYVPPASDIGKVFDAAEEWEKDLLLLLLSTGARISEILNLKWTDVTNDSIILWTRKRKNGSRQPRTIPIGDNLKGLFTKYREKGCSSIFVLVNPETQGPYKKSQPSIKFMLKRLCQKAGVARFGFHSLRHYFASCLLSTGKAAFADIQLLLGHQRMSTTDVYLHSLNPKLGHLANVIEDMNSTLK